MRKHNTIYLENDNGDARPLPVERVGNIHLFGEVDFNTALLRLLSKHGVYIHIYNYYGFYEGSYCPRKSKVSGYTVVHQASHYMDDKKRLYLARSFVLAGLHHMIRNLRKRSASPEVLVHSDTLKSYEHMMMEAKSIDELMGLEGKCRNIYYHAFQHLLKNNMKWESRSKQPPRDPVNALLSFGNSLMYTTILSEIYKTVLDPTISYLHEPSYKRFSLCLDMAEIFKPLIVDSIIFSLLNNKRLQKKHFQAEDEAVLLNDEGRRRFLSAFDEKLRTTFKHRKLKRSVSYRYLIRLEAYKLIKHVIGDELYKPFKAWW